MLKGLEVNQNKINLLHSLNVVQLEVTNNNKRQLYIKEISRSDNFPKIF